MAVAYDVFALTLVATNGPVEIVPPNNRSIVFVSVRNLTAGVALSLRLGRSRSSFQVYQGDQLDLSSDNHVDGLYYEAGAPGTAQLLVTYADAGE